MRKLCYPRSVVQILLVFGLTIRQSVRITGKPGTIALAMLVPSSRITSSITGDPMNKMNAVTMAIWAVENGLIGH
jgi:hypothetical protein